MPTYEPKPCPFCGSEAESSSGWRDDESFAFVRCLNCDAIIAVHDDYTGTDPELLLDMCEKAWNRRTGDQPQPKQRRDRRKCVHFRFPTAEIAHVWCAKYGPHYECLGAHVCLNYAEPPVMQAQNREGGQP